MHYELYTAFILGFFYLLRISEIETLMLGDISADRHDDKNYLSIKIKQSKTDLFKDGVLRSLIEVDSVLCPVKTFLTWKRLAFNEGGEKPSAFGVRLRARVSAIMKTSALANNVHAARIDTHSLRAGGRNGFVRPGCTSRCNS